MNGSDLKLLRESVGLSIVDLASMLQIYPTTVKRWEDQTEELSYRIELAVRAVIREKDIEGK